MADHHFTGEEGAVWMQPDGAATAMVFLGCHEVNSIDVPKGDWTPFFCTDPTGRGKFVASGETSAPPEAVTTQILEDVLKSLSYLEKQPCPFVLYINLHCSGRADIFTNYERTYILDVRKITTSTYENVALRDTSERSTVTHDVSASPPLIIVVDVTAMSQTLPQITVV